MLKELNKEINTFEESTKEKKAIEMDTPEEYIIQQKHATKFMDKEQKIPEETHVPENKEIN